MNFSKLTITKQLAAFIDKNGECIFGRDARGYLTIEIYDDCREQI